MIELIQLDEVDSTLTEAERRVRGGLRTSVVLCAQRQTRSYGRHGRWWDSPRGNLYWTAILFPDSSWPSDFGLTFASGLAVADTLRTLGFEQNRVRLKWPNDCLLDAGKVSGILLESGEISTPPSVKYILVGIGVNVTSAPLQTFYPATSILQAGIAPELSIVRDILTQSFLTRMGEWKQHGFNGWYDSYTSLLDGIGSTVQVATDRDRKNVMTGIHLGIDRSGALLLQTDAGEVHKITAGDVLGHAAS
ncbi:biotin--[acetyl-CoA-carboxylase] ligase [Bradyrhizobium icense]|uniref:biotin--[biotin carboxyl-carrier protein] ligase n=1 Tax=Bradyrhizobium icense TaxID=1274631 RepID=A0A1B1UBT2_9BRAD|nr:biotin--[acetyl-CoA-carboxylase] ligase [Bradyrhizobium icense]ANW00126.1 biotin--[acetyl-CoA-carboxylase] ligase [Bradyrhizobium icense]